MQEAILFRQLIPMLPFSKLQIELITE